MTNKGIPVGKIEKRGQYLKIAIMAAVLLCIISLLLPWLRFEVKTERGTIHLDSLGLQNPGPTVEKTLAQAVEDGGPAREYMAEQPAVTAITKQLIALESGMLGVVGTIEDSKLTPIETAILFANGGKALSQAAALVETAQSGTTMLDPDTASEILEHFSLDIQADFSRLATTSKLLAILNWLMIAALIAIGSYSIYALVKNRRSLVWAETALYGALLLLYCVFSYLLNQTISAQLADYAEIVGKDIRPFHISLWPVLMVVCLAGCLAAERTLPDAAVCFPIQKRAWICVCGRRNRQADRFCSACGRNRSTEARQGQASASGNRGGETPKIRTKMNGVGVNSTGTKGFRNPDDLG